MGRELHRRQGQARQRRRHQHQRVRRRRQGRQDRRQVPARVHPRLSPQGNRRLRRQHRKEEAAGQPGLLPVHLHQARLHDRRLHLQLRQVPLRRHVLGPQEAHQEPRLRLPVLLPSFHPLPQRREGEAVRQPHLRCPAQDRRSPGRLHPAAPHHQRPKKYDCDEYPFAASEEGGNPARGSTRIISAGDNRSAGARLGGFYKAQRVLNGDG
ncbi:NucA/NucB deoxyribonuclease domain-containing protein [Streptomyces sp. NPDC088246]|uniref:NucA/NucB deoxyribonuclease domain-containing protein n=1 Tax=Streptomyces sp. NPDC088246 TaxID=3365842 RepID=UPI003805D63B